MVTQDLQSNFNQLSSADAALLTNYALHFVMGAGHGIH